MSSPPEARPTGSYDRLLELCDPGSFTAIRADVKSSGLGEKACAGDGVRAGAGRVDGRPVFCYAQDSRFLAGSLGREQGETVARILGLAEQRRAPVVSFVESAGARVHEGLAGLEAYGRIFSRNVALSGRVPQISVISGVAAGGATYSPALTDFVIMERGASMFLTGPAVVRDVLGEVVASGELGGVGVHSRNGVCHLVADDGTHSVALVRSILSYLPQNAWEPPPNREPRPQGPGNLREIVPRDSRQVYDVREVARCLIDDGEWLELGARWARNVVTALARIDGRSVGIVANQPRHLGGVLDAEGSQKAARFVRTCNSFGVALIVLVDTPGFLPGRSQERAAVIRHGAKLLYAFSEAAVPKVSVVLRKAFGGAYICMNSKSLGADWTFAWEGAELGVMGAPQAVRIMHRREFAATEDAHALEQFDRRTLHYAEEYLAARRAAETGHIDEVIEPELTRARLSAVLSVLGVRSDDRSGLHGNIPL